MRKILLTIASLSFFVSSLVFALMDTKSGNYKKTFTDFIIEGSAFPLSLIRTYNSRSLYKGLFGVGWCSNIETRADVLPDNTVKVTECGGGQETIYISKKASQNIQQQVEKIISAVKRQNKRLSDNYFKKLRQKLLRSNVLRSEFLRAYRIIGQPIKGTPYLAEGRSNELLIFDNRGWFRRVLPSGVDQFFDVSTGHLVQVSDRTGNYLKFVWKNGKPQYVQDQRGRKVAFQYQQGQISRVVGLGKTLAKYTIRGEDLVEVQNQDGIYRHTYDDLHNLTETQYPAVDKKVPTEKLTYNKKKDWVTSFRNRRGCLETYTYKTNAKNSNHYWTDVKKVCGKTVTNVSRYEFWNKKRPNGSMYLHRARQDVNGEVSDVTYHPQFKRASSVTRGGVRTQYQFYKNGLLKSKMAAGQRTVFSSYHKKCRKPNVVEIQSLSKKRVGKKQVISISYSNSSCLMTKVERSDGRWVRLSHDEKGRISLMKDQTGKTIVVAYDDNANKPNKITHEGVGSIEMTYDKNGRSKGWKPGSDPIIMSQVMSVFNGLISMISPIRREVNI